MLNKVEKDFLLSILSLYGLDKEDNVYIKREFDTLSISTDDCFLGSFYIAILEDSNFKKIMNQETYCLIDLL